MTSVIVVCSILGVLACMLLAYVAIRRGSARPLEGPRLARAQREFRRQQPTLQAAFFRHAAASGRPRGLRWTRCDFDDGVVFAKDRNSGDLLALASVTISFEAIPGGPMEDVEAVGNLRAGTALFTYTPRGWQTTGRALFNLEPKDALARPEWQLELLPEPLD